MSKPTARGRALLALGLAAALVAACGTDSPRPAATGEPAETEEETTTTTEAPDDEDDEEAATIEVVGVEYAFEGLDGEIEAGTELTFTNQGEEAHELVLFRLAEGETRSVEELLALPDEEVEDAVELIGVAVAEPGADGRVVEGELVLDEPGDYVAICFFPVGTTEVPEGPPTGDEQEQGGPPHFTQGMLQELTVR
jgi:plastocyanin